MSAALLRSASFQFVPSSVKSLMPPPPFIVPVRWAPKLFLHSRHNKTAFGASSSPNGAQRRRADTHPLPQSGFPAPSERLGQGAAPHASGGQPYGPSEVSMPPCDLLSRGEFFAVAK
jgi:hypothetical protein